MTPGIAKVLAWSAASVLVYALALKIYRWRNAHPFLIPVATGAALIMALLALLDEPYPVYAQSTGLLRSPWPWGWPGCWARAPRWWRRWRWRCA